MTPYYQDDAVTLFHGDCREVLDDPDLEYLNAMATVMVTDPPYGIGWKRSANPARSSAAHGGILNDHDTAARDWALGVWPDRPAIAFGSFYAPHPANVAQVLVWKKPNDAGVVGSVTGFRRDAEPVFLVGPWPQRPCERSSVLTSTIPNIGSPSSPAGQTGHPHAKPVDLMRYLIEMCPPGLIIDPFAGAGSTLVAAKQAGRRAIGIELDERYCKTAANRCGQGLLDFGEAS